MSLDIFSFKKYDFDVLEVISEIWDQIQTRHVSTSVTKCPMWEGMFKMFQISVTYQISTALSFVPKVFVSASENATKFNTKHIMVCRNEPQIVLQII